MTLSVQNMPRALNRIAQQPRVCEFFAAALRDNRLSHAYLFVGPPGAGKTEAARALAQCVVCPHGGDGSCDECIRVAHGTHPDVRVFSPGSAQGYLVNQIREIIAEVPLAPVRAQSKVYILTDVGLLRGTAANALLKTIEEPPEGVRFILIARSVAQVLPTIASRCQQVPFRVIASDAAIAVVRERTGFDDDACRIALAASGTPERAVSFLSSADRRQVRRLVVRTIGELPRDDSWDVLKAAEQVLHAVQVASGMASADGKSQRRDKVVEAELKRRTDGVEDYLSTTALRQLGDTVKRELTARERSGMMEALAAVSSLLRDVLIRLTEVDQPIVNADVAEVVERLAKTSNADGVLTALGAVSAAADDLVYNVSPQLTLEVMLLRIKEALICPPLSR